MPRSDLSIADLHEEIINTLEEIQNHVEKSIDYTEDNSYSIGTFNWDFIELEDLVSQIQGNSTYIRETILEIANRIP